MGGVRYSCVDDVTKGRCHKCQIVWWWKRGTRCLKDTTCPSCGGRLRATTHLCKKSDWRQHPADRTKAMGKL